jgi:hypothetical protein
MLLCTCRDLEKSTAQKKHRQALSFIRDHAIPPQFNTRTLDFKAPLPSSQARLKEGGPDSS